MRGLVSVRCPYPTYAIGHSCAKSVVWASPYTVVSSPISRPRQTHGITQKCTVYLHCLFPTSFQLSCYVRRRGRGVIMRIHSLSSLWLLFPHLAWGNSCILPRQAASAESIDDNVRHTALTHSQYVVRGPHLGILTCGCISL